MTVYLDTSSLVKLYVDESGSDEIERLVAAADVIVTSTLAYPEARVAFARRRHERLLTADAVRKAGRQLDADWRRFAVIALDDDLAQAAGRLADVHDLRGADAVHLASFELLLSRIGDGEAHFSCADDRLSRAAARLG